MLNSAAFKTETVWDLAMESLRDPNVSPEEKAGSYARLEDVMERMTTMDIALDLSRDFIPTYLNLLWLNEWFGDASSKRDLAARCVKSRFINEAEFLLRLSRLRQTSELPPAGELACWPKRHLQSLLAGGKGLIIGTTKTGPYRHIPLEFALHGHPILIAVNAPSVPIWKAAADQMNARLNECRVQLANAEERSGIFAMARALRAGHVVVIYFEGTTGTDGPWGRGSRSEVQYFGKTLRVRNGIARLNRLAPILPMTTVTTSDGVASVMCGEPLPVTNCTEDDEPGLQRVMQHLFGFAESVISAYPHQSETFSALDRMKAPEPEHREVAQTVLADDVIRHLKDGGRVRLETSRCVLCPSSTGLYCIDSRTMRGVLVPPAIAAVVKSLDSPTAYLDRNHFDIAVAAETRQHGIQSIAALISRGLMRMSAA